jgi:hypothetical protein
MDFESWGPSAEFWCDDDSVTLGEPAEPDHRSLGAATLGSVYVPCDTEVQNGCAIDGGDADLQCSLSIEDTQACADAALAYTLELEEIDNGVSLYNLGPSTPENCPPLAAP